jgi:hypothetical protein
MMDYMNGRLDDVGHGADRAAAPVRLVLAAAALIKYLFFNRRV